MAQATTSKLNKKDFGDIYYIGYPRSFAAPSLQLTPSSRILGGFLGSFPGFQRLYKDITGLLKIPSATITRGLGRLKDKCGLERTAPGTYSFNQDDTAQSVKGKWYCPLDIITDKYKIHDDKGNVIDTRKLTYSMQDVYAYFYTKLSREHNSDGYLEFTNKEIASELGYDEETVSKALDVLKHAKLIYFPKAHKGVNRHKKSRVSLIKKWRWFRKENQYRARVKKENSAVKPTAITRDEYYGKLQELAQRKAYRARRRAERNEEYKTLTEEITDVRSLFLRAVSESEQAKHSADIERLTAKREVALKNIGLSEEQLDVGYYAKCKCCNDTGYTSDGERCDCFDNGARGSPPKDGKKAGRRTE